MASHPSNITDTYHCTARLAPLSGGISFECFREQGAVLAISEDATRQDAHLLVNYQTYMLENCSRWLALVEMQGLGLRMEDIVLVTGCDLTSAWAVAAFTDSGVDASVQLHVGATPAGAVDFGTNVSWRNERNVERHWGPRRRMTYGFGADPFQQVATPSSEQNQCIFIRGYRVKFRSRFLPKKLVAAAEPVDYDMDDDEDHGLVSTVGSYGNNGMLEVESIADDSVRVIICVVRLYRRLTSRCLAYTPLCRCPGLHTRSISHSPFT